jgi:hypothetical protein
MSKKIAVALAFSALLVGGPMPLAAPDQSYPGQPTQARVWIQNQGLVEAVPVSLQAIAGDATMKVQVVGTQSVAVSSAPVLDTRRARQTWEYHRVLATADDDLTPQLSQLGRDGWETAFQYMTTRGGLAVVLKRPRQP